MSENTIIRNMLPEELAFAAACTFAEGWQGESLLELAGPFSRDPAGSFIAEVGGKPVGMCMGVDYGAFGFLGGLIVVPAARGRGIGEALLMHTVHFLLARGLKSVFLDGVFPAVRLYERCGFQKVCRSLRFLGRPSGRLAAQVEPMTAQHLDAVCELDREAFGADRRFFLKRRFSLYPYFCRVAVVDGRVEGYIMARPGHTVLAVGPWIASHRLEQPQILLEALTAAYPLLPVSLGCLADNKKAVEYLRASGFTERKDPPWRMVYGEMVKTGDATLNFAVGSPAKG